MAQSDIVLDSKGTLRSMRKFVKIYPKVVSQKLEQVGQSLLIKKMKRRLELNESVVTRKLIRGLKAKATVTSRSVVLAIDTGTRYGPAVEFGSQPRTVPLSKLISYVSKKHGVSGPEAIRLAQAIQRSIAAKGTKAHPYALPVWEESKTEFVRRFISRMDRDRRLNLNR